MADGRDAFVVSLYRGATGLLFVLFWLALRPRGNGLASRRLWSWSAIAGLGVAVAATLMYCTPVFVYLVSFALKPESATAMKWVAIAVAMLGIVLLTQVYDIGASSVTPVGEQC